MKVPSIIMFKLIRSEIVNSHFSQNSALKLGRSVDPEAELKISTEIFTGYANDKLEKVVMFGPAKSYREENCMHGP